MKLKEEYFMIVQGHYILPLLTSFHHLSEKRAVNFRDVLAS